MSEESPTWDKNLKPITSDKSMRELLLEILERVERIEKDVASMTIYTVKLK